MSTRKKLYLFVYIAGILFVVFLLSALVVFIEKTPAAAVSAEEVTDTSITQYTERMNSHLTTASDLAKSSLIARTFSKSKQIPDDCTLRFAFTPIKKSLTAGDTNNYIATITNKGRDVCKNVSLSIYYEENEYFISSDPSPTASDYYWEIGNVQYQKEYVINLNTRIDTNNKKSITSSACVTADNSPDVCSESILFIENKPKNTNLTTMLKIYETTNALWDKTFNSSELGIWVWDHVNSMTPTYMDEVISSSKKSGFSAIYITIDDYIPIGESGNVTEKENYMKELSIFITAANSSGIQVDAVGGAKDWAQNENRWKGYMLIDFLTEYNAKYPNAKVRNLQYDVEPYLLSNYATNKEQVLKEYVEFIDESVTRLQSSSFGFSIVIPHFYDSEQLWTPSFKYEESEAYTFTHLLTILRRKQNTQIIIMSYRNFFEGDNGVKQISEAEISEASQIGYETKIIIAQETGNVSPNYVTYHDQKRSDLFSTLSQIQKHFGNKKNYGGVAVHYFDSFVKLTDTE